MNQIAALPVLAPEADAEHPPLRPLMLSCQFMPEVFAGAEQQCLRLAVALRDLGHAPQILTSRSDPDTAAYEHLEGIPVTRLLTSAPPQLGGRRILSTFSWMRRVADWCRTQRSSFDLIHCHQAKINAWAGVRVAQKLGCPVVVKPGSAGENLDFKSLERKRFFYGRMAAGQIARGANAVVAISGAMNRDLSLYGIGANRRVAIPNGIPLTPSSPGHRGARRRFLREELGIPEDATVLLFAGRMERQKNLETLLRAMTLLESQPTLVVMGDGALLERHKATAHALGLKSQVRFVGRVNEVRDRLALADIFVLPALAEGMSNALLEAMEEGLVPVASRVSGNSDLIRNGQNGYLYGPPEHPLRLASALNQALTDGPARRAALGRAARHTVRAGYGMDSVARRYVELYRNLLATGRPA